MAEPGSRFPKVLPFNQLRVPKSRKTFNGPVLLLKLKENKYLETKRNSLGLRFENEVLFLVFKTWNLSTSSLNDSDFRGTRPFILMAHLYD